MLRPERIPTPLVEARQLAPITIRAASRPGRFQTARLLLRLARFALALAWSARVRHAPPAQLGALLREFFESMGGLWVKAGQLLSLRADLLPADMQRELMQLQYRAEGFAGEQAREIVAATLGRPLEQIFDIFEPQPFAAASVAQVHRARLRAEAAWVAVKVQRPYIAAIFRRDLAIISWLLRMLARVPALRYITWEGMIRELQQMMREELDYRYETANLRRMRKLLRHHKVYVPKVYEPYGGAAVVVMEYLQGVLMSDFLQAARADAPRLADWCAANNIRPRKVGARLLLSFYRQLFEDNLFHGDLHPGNIMLLRDSRFALIDFGTVGNLEARFVANYQKQAIALAEHDYAKAADLYLLLADTLPPTDTAGFRTDLIEIYRAWSARTQLRGLSYLEKSISGGVANDVQAVARRYQVNPSWQFLRVARALSTLDASLNVLLGDADPNKLIRKYQRQLARRQLRRLRKAGLRALVKAVGSASEAAGYISDGLRRGAVQFEGAISTGARVGLTLLAVLRVALLLGILVLAYDVAHQHAFGLVRRIHPWLGAFGRSAELIPPLPLELGLAALLLAALLFRSLSRLRRSLAQPRVRLPNGRLDG